MIKSTKTVYLSKNVIINQITRSFILVKSYYGRLKTKTLFFFFIIFQPLSRDHDDSVTSHFVMTVDFAIPDALCSNSLSHFVIPDALCNKLLPHFVIPDHTL